MVELTTEAREKLIAFMKEREVDAPLRICLTHG